MPWLTAGMTLVPSARPMSMAPWPSERDELGVDLVLEGHVQAGVAVVALLLRQVELGELDARDVAEADLERRQAASAIGAAWHAPASGDAPARRR